MLDILEVVFILDELDTHATEPEPQVAPVEELESFLVDPSDPTKLLEVGKWLSTEIKERLNTFLHRNLDVFAWKNENMVGIDLKVSCHHLKINPKATLHR